MSVASITAPTPAWIGPRTPLPPGPRMPVALQTLAWMKRPLPFLERAHARYGDAFTMHIGRETLVALSDPADVRQVFTGDASVYHAGKANIILLPFLGWNSLLLLDGDAHLSQRRLILPSFHGEKMRANVGLMEEIAAREVGAWPLGEPFAVHPRMQALTLEVIVRVVFGVDEESPLVDELRRQLSALVNALATQAAMLKVLINGPVRAHRRRVFGALLDPVDAVIARVIAERRARDDLAERDDVLSTLLLARHEDGSPMSDDELRDELATLLVAGHETTATALSWALERLTRHPEALDRLYDETDAEHDAYVDAVIRETLRLRPVIPFVGRVLQAPQTLGGYDLPAGTRIAPSIHLVHRRPELYPDPAAFRPERWMGVRPNPYHFLPFGGGVRRCPGATFAETEMRAVLGAIIAAVRLRPAHPGSERVARRAITLVPADGARIVARRAAPARAPRG